VWQPDLVLFGPIRFGKDRLEKAAGKPKVNRSHGCLVISPVPHDLLP